MTRNQIRELDENELSMIMYIVNVISPPDGPRMEFEPDHLVWFRHDLLIKKLMDAFPKITPEGHPIFISLMAKLGIKVEIKQQPPPPVAEQPPLQTTGSNISTENTGSQQTTGSL